MRKERNVRKETNEEKTLLALKELFSRIKQFYFGTGDKPLSAAQTDAGEATEYIAAIKEAEAALSSFTGEKGMLAETLRIVREALLDKNYRMAGDFSDAGVHLCGVYRFPCLGREKFFKRYVLPLRDKHCGDFYAAEEKDFLAGKNLFLRLSPSFVREKDTARYYTVDYDEEFHAAHPIYYALFVLLGLCLFVGAIVAFAVISHTVLPVSGAVIILGYFGAAGIGTALVSLTMSFIRQYMGHPLTVGAALFGTVALLVTFLA